MAEGETVAVIGPNGAGKTTLIGQLAGDLRPDAGTIRFAGCGRHRACRRRVRSHRGLARSFQITSIFREFSALDNVALAVQAHAGHSFRFWRPARDEAALREPARALLEQVGLGARADVVAGTLAHGEQRQLEIAMALATRPRLLLLDEPVAGMGAERVAAHGAAAAHAARAPHDRAGRARHGRGLRAGRPHQRAGLRPGDRLRRRPRRSGVDPEVRRAYLGEEISA